MAKSFTVNLNDYTVCWTIGMSRRSTERKADTLDLISILMDEGYHCFETPVTYCAMKGEDRNGLRFLIRAMTVGLPCDAVVSIRHLGKHKTVLVSFKDHGGEG